MCVAHEGEMLPSRLGTTRRTRGDWAATKKPKWRAAGGQHEMAEGGWVWVSLLARAVKRVQLQSSAGRHSVLLGLRWRF